MHAVKGGWISRTSFFFCSAFNELFVFVILLFLLSFFILFIIFLSLFLCFFVSLFLCFFLFLFLSFFLTNLLSFSYNYRLSYTKVCCYGSTTCQYRQHKNIHPQTCNRTLLHMNEQNVCVSTPRVPARLSQRVCVCVNVSAITQISSLMMYPKQPAPALAFCDVPLVLVFPVPDRSAVYDQQAQR